LERLRALYASGKQGKGSIQLSRFNLATISQVEKWSQLILDESHILKNSASKYHKTVRRLTFERVLPISGTPVENNIQELWSTMSILNPGLLRTKTDFMKRFRKRIADGDNRALKPYQ
jgi:SNF2 family DNA or RNA helicase